VSEEASFMQRVADRPALQPKRIAGVRGRDLAYRFGAGALTSAVAGVVTLALGARAGGLLLAFPAILAASLTLIEEEEEPAESREDARGAVLGGCGMAVFAAVAAVLFGHFAAALALGCAAAAWLLSTVILYLILWAR
jgi:hypothetical protein